MTRAGRRGTTGRRCRLRAPTRCRAAASRGTAARRARGEGAALARLAHLAAALADADAKSDRRRGAAAAAHPGREALPISSVGASRAAARWAWPSSPSSETSPSHPPSPCRRRPDRRGRAGALDGIALSRTGSSAPHVGEARPTPPARAERVGAGATHVRQRGARRRRAVGSSSSTTPKATACREVGAEEGADEGDDARSPADTAGTVRWPCRLDVLNRRRRQRVRRRRAVGGARVKLVGRALAHAVAAGGLARRPRQVEAAARRRARRRPEPDEHARRRRGDHRRRAALVRADEWREVRRAVEDADEALLVVRLAQPSANDVKLSVSPTADDDAWIRTSTRPRRHDLAIARGSLENGLARAGGRGGRNGTGETRTESAARRGPE